MRIILACLLVFLGFATKPGFGQNKEIEKFFVDLKNLNYESAKYAAKNVKDELLRSEMLQLAHVLAIAGQNKMELGKEEYGGNDLVDLIAKLSHGYYNLYTNPYDEKPFRYFNEAYVISKEINVDEVTKFCVLSILEVYNFEISQSNEDQTQFLDRFKRLITDNADEYHYRMNLLHFNLRDIFLNIRLDKAFFKEFDDLMTSFDENHYFWPNYHSSKGVFFESLNEFDEAIILHELAIEEIGNEQFLKYIKFRSNIRLSEIYRNQDNYQKAIEYINVANRYKDLVDTIRSSYYINFYLSRNLHGLKKFNEAYEHLAQANELKIKLDYQANSIEIAHLNMRYQTQERELELLKEKAKVRETKNLLIAAFFLLIFTTSIYFLIQKNTKRKQLLAIKEKDIQEQKVVNLLKEQEMATIDAMISGQEKERQRIANDLHDDLGGLMATINLHFDVLKDEANAKPNALFDKTDSLIKEAYDKIRTISHAKNSGVIAKEGLLKSVVEMANKVSIANNLKINVIDHGLDNRLQNSLELGLFRIIQELITNVVKHSNASEANIHLTNHGDSLNIMIEDDGVGFNTHRLTTRKSGIGIKNIDKRIEYLHGSMEIDSEIGRGTTIIINLPI